MGGWIHGLLGPAFPWGTFVVNVAGCFALGLSVRLLHASVVAPETRAFLTVGVLGAFTTFSTFSYEAATLLQDGKWVRAAAYVGGSVLLGLVAVLAGFWLAASLLQARA